jgi:5-methyltetrahydropteroyltriglutamate--homocysteine methyltransferase
MTTTTPFPTATILGYPRIGRGRELKRAVEAHWAGRLDADGLRTAEAELRHATHERLIELGLGRDDASIPETFALYDQVLDAISLIGAVPQRFAGREGLDLHFALARGDATVAPLEMTKWFDTNYHYLVPEIGPDTPIRLTDRTVVDRFAQALGWGVTTRPVLVGPVTLLALAKAADGSPEGWSPLERLDEVVAAYRAALALLAEAGAPWAQLDEPALVSDNLPTPRGLLIEAAGRAYRRLAAPDAGPRPALLVTTPYGDGAAALPALAAAGVEAIHLDLVRAGVPEAPGPRALAGTTLVGGVVDGRNIWAADLAEAADRLEALRRVAESSGASGTAVATSTSLQHVPHDTALEHWEDPVLDTALHDWLAFADQKVGEVTTLARGLRAGRGAIASEIARSQKVLAERAEAPGVCVPAVRTRVASLTEADRTRVGYPVREAAQARRLGLPDLPTTTIGSFPQTADIRRARAAHARGELDDAAYESRIKAEVARVIALQEEIGLDVLVHGEPERNDMVQYFAEQLAGFAVTREGWVQSYGSRCTRPSILWGDVWRPEPITVPWTAYAQSLTARPVKGMLTGPVTIIAWSFPREDIPLSEVGDQIALALRDEVADLEDAGTPVIQVDEPALRELLPLEASRHADYLAWAVGAFRAATAGVRPDTQIHTHLCYSEFGQILDAIAGLDADVTSIEAARSRMEVLPELASHGFARGIGPGVWDIHSPRVPSAEELAGLIGAAARTVPVHQLWVNPDCGLKTRAYPETEATLRNLVQAARTVRERIGAAAARRPAFTQSHDADQTLTGVRPAGSIDL